MITKKVNEGLDILRQLYSVREFGHINILLITV